ncbi:hypothetical protein GQ457_14G017990 [Hibiscus cannabinus]
MPSGKTDILVGPSGATDIEKHVKSNSLVEVQVEDESGSLESSSQSVSIEPCFDPSTGLYSVRPKILKGFNNFKLLSPGLYLNKSWRSLELGKADGSILESSRKGLKKVDSVDVEIINEGLSVVTRPRRPRVSRSLDLSGMLSESSLTLWRLEGKEDQGITFIQVRFYGYGSMYKQWGGSVFCIFGLEYRYSLVLSVPEFNTGIRVSVLLDEYRHPFEIM